MPTFDDPATTTNCDGDGYPMATATGVTVSTPTATGTANAFGKSAYLLTDIGDSSTNSSSGFNLLSPAVKYTIYGIAAAVALALFAFLFWCCRRRRRARRAAREAAIPPKNDFSRYESPGTGDSPLEYGILGTKGGQTVYWK